MSPLWEVLVRVCAIKDILQVEVLATQQVIWLEEDH
jgi:hypothetical protein